MSAGRGLRSLIRTVAPAELPLTLDEIKAHLRVEGDADDGMLMLYLRAVVDAFDGAEGLLERALITQTWQLRLDQFPCDDDAIDLALPPLQSVSSVAYLDADGASQTLAADRYRVLNAGTPSRRGRIECAYGQSWPTTRCVEQAVTITFVAGYGARNAIPESTRALLLMAVKETYDHRDPIAVSAMFRSPGYDDALWRAKFHTL